MTTNYNTLEIRVVKGSDQDSMGIALTMHTGYMKFTTAINIDYQNKESIIEFIENVKNDKKSSCDCGKMELCYDRGKISFAYYFTWESMEVDITVTNDVKKSFDEMIKLIKKNFN